MVKNIEELKALIIFAREQKLKSLKIGEIQMEISDIAHISELPNIPEMGTSKNSAVTASMGSMLEELGQLDPEEEDLLYHSSRP